ncbi:winged helix-turn-helix domain-containing protein [Desulfatirhabdium butyrativorans]|uniref:winged helix-turn-helix domain-containing protein n=2 Tax=Desulfatirhabdium butyrativorans TaxID=340467 RepID=UPI0004877585|nr:winged helix-turn-helix domain-containing protein [Desulfatirhabdium butyrativorans]
MARPAKFTENAVEAARLFVKEAETARDLRIGLSILIPKIFGVSNANAAEVLGVGKATVVRMQKEIRDRVAGKSKPKASWGGRRRGHLSFEQEKEFLDPWIVTAERGGVLVVPPIHAAYEERIGCHVAASTVYRMLARHGWRKIAPDTCHPKRDAQSQEDFKKNSKKRWRRPPSRMS